MQKLDNIYLSDKLHMIRTADDRITFQAIANQFNTDVKNVRYIVDSRDLHRQLCKTSDKRKNLTLGDKIKILHFMEKKHCTATKVERSQKVIRWNVGNTWKMCS